MAAPGAMSVFDAEGKLVEEGPAGQLRSVVEDTVAAIAL